MNIKSLLLGSAAALVASGAYAADAVEVIAEPEPMDYVRVCDVAGTGFFYIPGTETCLRIGGYVRYDIGGGDVFGSVREDHLDGGLNDTYSKNARLSLQTWTYSDTEYGALTTYTETRFNYTNADNSYGISEDGSNFSLNFAWIQLGGLRIGKDESVFTTFPGYAGGVLSDDIIGFGPYDTNLISYYFDAGNGFSAVVSLEEGSDGRYFVRDDLGNLVQLGGHDYRIDSYVPHVVAGAKFTQGWGAITGVVGYDSTHEVFSGKVRLDVNVADNFSLFVMGGWGDDDDYNFYKPWSENWAVWGGGTYALNEKAKINVQLSYDEAENFAAVANVAYDIVPGFTITPEVAYVDNFDIDDSDAFGARIRFQRSF